MVFEGFRCEPEVAISDMFPPCHSDLAAPVLATGSSDPYGRRGIVGFLAFLAV